MSMPISTCSPDRVQSLPDAEIISQSVPSSVSALDITTMRAGDDSPVQSPTSMQAESPLQTALTQVENICRSIVLQRAG